MLKKIILAEFEIHFLIPLSLKCLLQCILIRKKLFLIKFFLYFVVIIKRSTVYCIYTLNFYQMCLCAHFF